MKQINQSKTNFVFTDLSIKFERHKVKALQAYETSNGTDIWYTTFASDAITKGLRSWYIDKDIIAAKQWFYLAAKLTAFSTTKASGNEKLWALHPFMFPLLSDSPEMIKLYSTLETPNLIARRDDPNNNEFDIDMVQLALQGNDAKLHERIAYYKSASNQQASKSIISFMEALLDGDLAKMQAAIILLSSWEQRNPATEDFFADYGVVFTKLAWLRGYAVEIDSPIVPMDFMPVAPLEYYDDVYEFLKPGWQTPTLHATPEKKGLFARIFGDRFSRL